MGTVTSDKEISGSADVQDSKAGIFTGILDLDTKFVTGSPK